MTEWPGGAPGGARGGAPGGGRGGGPGGGGGGGREDAQGQLRAFKTDARGRPEDERRAAFEGDEFRRLIAAAAVPGAPVAGAACATHCISHCGSHCFAHEPVGAGGPGGGGGGPGGGGRY
jgi:hypothetical protein